MSVLELKGDILQMISHIDSEKRLQDIRDVVSKYADKEDNNFWEDYTPEQKTELEKAFEESYDPTNGIAHEDMKKKHAKWLNG
jgi:hypothetical protein